MGFLGLRVSRVNLGSKIVGRGLLGMVDVGGNCLWRRSGSHGWIVGLGGGKRVSGGLGEESGVHMLGVGMGVGCWVGWGTKDGGEMS